MQVTVVLSTALASLTKQAWETGVWERELC